MLFLSFMLVWMYHLFRLQIISNPSLPCSAPLDPIGFFKQQHIKVSMCAVPGGVLFVEAVFFLCMLHLECVSVHVVVVECVCVCLCMRCVALRCVLQCFLSYSLRALGLSHTRPL